MVSMVGAVGVVGIAQSFSSRAVELQPQRCGPKTNCYDRSLTAQRPSAVGSSMPARSMDGCKADRASVPLRQGESSAL